MVTERVDIGIIEQRVRFTRKQILRHFSFCDTLLVCAGRAGDMLQRAGRSVEAGGVLLPPEEDDPPHGHHSSRYHQVRRAPTELGTRNNCCDNLRPCPVTMLLNIELKPPFRSSGEEIFSVLLHVKEDSMPCLIVANPALAFFF